MVSVNLGAPRPLRARGAHTGIDKRPVAGRVEVRAPGRKGVGGSGLVGDAVCNLKHHGGDDQAVYAFAREELDHWQVVLGRALPQGAFGENLTVSDIDPDEARIGERWRVGPALVLQVTAPRIPCGVFARFLDVRGWIEQFNARARPGAYLRVIRSGDVGAGDAIEVEHRPAHDVTVSTVLRAFTTHPALLASLLAAADDLPADVRLTARRAAAGSSG